MKNTLDENNLKLKLTRLQNDLKTWTTLLTCLHSRAQNLIEPNEGQPPPSAKNDVTNAERYLDLANIAQGIISDLETKIGITKDQLVLAQVIPPPSP